MRKRRLLPFALALVLLLTGCGAAREPAASPTGAAETPLPTEAPAPPSVEADPGERPRPEPHREVLRIEPEDTELVCVTDYIPDLYVELRYATSDNFTGQVIYDFSDAWLRYGTVKKLSCVQQALREAGYSLKIWDAYRPAAAQFKLWEVVPVAAYVANPYTGHSSHSCGGTVDLTLVLSDGSILEMPTDFDEFSALADRDYGDVSSRAGENALYLERVMAEAGFSAYVGEWWHFSDRDAYPFEDLEKLRFSLDRSARYVPDGETLELRAAPSPGAELLGRVPPEAAFCVLGWAGDYARIEYYGQQGYVEWARIRSE